MSASLDVPTLGESDNEVDADGRIVRQHGDTDRSFGANSICIEFIVPIRFSPKLT
jgi:hypothetical protein